jgi:hypothetical protein
VPAGFALRVVAVPPGDELAYVAGDWSDAVVVVEHGEVELECLAGGRRAFACGAVLWLAGMPLRALRNPGPEPAVLSAVSRRADDFSPPPQSGDLR